jgi:integrase
MITLREFFDTHGHRFWSKGKYFDTVSAQIHRFCDFRNYDSRGLSEFKPIDFYEFMDHLSLEGASDSTINRYLSSLQKIFREAKDMEFINRAPKVKWLKISEGRSRVFTQDEIKMILDYLGRRHEWMKCYCIIGLHTGVRLGDIQKISTQTISNCRTKLYLETTKNGDSREVLLNDDAQKAVQRLLEINGNKFVHSTFRRTWNAMRKEFVKMGNITDPGAFVFHAFRHTCASILANDLNINLGIVSKVLGHRNIKTTIKYVHAKSGVVSGVMDQIAQYHSRELGPMETEKAPHPPLKTNDFQKTP